MATKDARRGFEEGNSRNARVLHSAPSAPEGSCGQPRWRSEAYALDRIFLARCGVTASSETGTPPTHENDELREGRDDPVRARILALEGVPVRRI